MFRKVFVKKLDPAAAGKRPYNVHVADNGQWFMVLNYDPKRLTGMPPGYILPYADDTAPFVFPVPDTGKQLNWKRNWAPNNYKPLLWWVVVFLVLAYYGSLLLVGCYLFGSYLYYLYIVIWPVFKKQVLPFFLPDFLGGDLEEE